jgi:hypothetical protein
VPEAEEGGAEAELQYVEVLKDTEGAQVSPVAFNPLFQIYYATIDG